MRHTFDSALLRAKAESKALHHHSLISYPTALSGDCRAEHRIRLQLQRKGTLAKPRGTVSGEFRFHFSHGGISPARDSLERSFKLA